MGPITMVMDVTVNIHSQYFLVLLTGWQEQGFSSTTRQNSVSGSVFYAIHQQHHLHIIFLVISEVLVTSNNGIMSV